MILNEATGMISGMQTELVNIKKQYDIVKKYNSGLKTRIMIQQFCLGKKQYWGFVCSA
jgi:hypothetical protein